MNIFNNFNGRFTVLEVDTELYEKYARDMHESGISISSLDKMVRLMLGRPLVRSVLGKAKNLMVETGRELHASLMVNDVSHYAGHLYPTYIHVGSGTTPPTVDDWKLENPWSSGGRYAITVAERDVHSHCKWEATIPSGDSGTIAELGLFLQEDPPAFNPQNESSQYPYSMLHRALLATPVTKSAGSTEVIIYEAVF